MPLPKPVNRRILIRKLKNLGKVKLVGRCW